jgi:hypothetical protein
VGVDITYLKSKRVIDLSPGDIVITGNHVAFMVLSPPTTNNFYLFYKCFSFATNKVDSFVCYVGGVHANSDITVLC